MILIRAINCKVRDLAISAVILTFSAAPPAFADCYSTATGLAGADCVAVPTNGFSHASLAIGGGATVTSQGFVDTAVGWHAQGIGGFSSAFGSNSSASGNGSTAGGAPSHAPHKQ